MRQACGEFPEKLPHRKTSRPQPESAVSGYKPVIERLVLGCHLVHATGRFRAGYAFSGVQTSCCRISASWVRLPARDDLGQLRDLLKLRGTPDGIDSQVPNQARLTFPRPPASPNPTILAAGEATREPEPVRIQRLQTLCCSRSAFDRTGSGRVSGHFGFPLRVELVKQIKASSSGRRPTPKECKPVWR